MNTTNQNLSLRLDRARWWLLSAQPFYGALAMGLPDILSNPHGKTACTDGRKIMWDPAFLEKLTDEETRFVLAHETLHCAHGHLWRLPAREPEAQQACDHEINLTLAAVPGMRMPAGGLADPGFANLACEEIYGRLKRAPEPQGGEPGGDDAGSPGDGEGDEPGDSGKGQTPDPGQSGGFCEPDESDGAQPGDKPGQPKIGAQNLREEWDQRVIQAAQSAAALGRGDMPGDLQRVLDRVRAQPIDWRRELADFVKSAQGVRNDWSRSARRMATQPVIYPRKRVDDLGLVLLCRDTSGSISDVICAECTSLIASLTGEMNCSAIVLDCDAEIQAEYRLSPGEMAPLEAKGGGGTAFEPVFDRVAQLQDEGEHIAGVVYLTDLEGSFPQYIPNVPVLWLAIDTDQQAPFGRTVRIFTHA